MSVLKKAIVSAAYHTGFLRWRAGWSRRPGFRVLMYHHVLAEADPYLPHLTIDVFARQIDFLRTGMRVLPLEDLAGMLSAGREIPPRSVALTFDDEYQDIYRHAFPLLKKFALPATVFIATGFVDTDRVPWTDELGFLLKKTGKKAVEIDAKKGEVFSLKGEEDRLRALKAIKARLKAMAEGRRRELYEEIRKQLAVSAPNPMRILGRREIREMTAAGIGFGAHTVSHPILTRVPPEEARREIVDSKRMIEEMSGRRASGFCYPNGEEGDFSPEIERMVRAAGFAYACSTIEGINSAGTGAYELKRMWTSEPAMALFAARLSK